MKLDFRREGIETQVPRMEGKHRLHLLLGGVKWVGKKDAPALKIHNGPVGTAVELRQSPQKPGRSQPMPVREGNAAAGEEGKEFAQIGLPDQIAAPVGGIAEILLQTGVMRPGKTLGHIPKGVYKALHFRPARLAALGKIFKNLQGKGHKGQGYRGLVPIGKTGHIVVLLLPQLQQAVNRRLSRDPIQVPVVIIALHIRGIGKGNARIPDALFFQKHTQGPGAEPKPILCLQPLGGGCFEAGHDSSPGRSTIR